MSHDNIARPLPVQAHSLDDQAHHDVEIALGYLVVYAEGYHASTSRVIPASIKIDELLNALAALPEVWPVMATALAKAMTDDCNPHGIERPGVKPEWLYST